MEYKELTNWLGNVAQSPLTFTNKFPFPVSIHSREENAIQLFVVTLKPGKTHYMVIVFSMISMLHFYDIKEFYEVLFLCFLL